jgi:enoyl-CoA hydratase/carnithine racemase
VVCALGGAAFGGGCELAASCDVRVAHAGVQLGMPPAKLGIAYPARGLARFAALCGESRARELFLAARTIDAETARAWGLVDHLVPAADVLPRAHELAGEIAALVPGAVAAMRATFERMIKARAAGS